LTSFHRNSFIEPTKLPIVASFFSFIV